MVEVVVVVIEADRQTLEDGSGELRRFHPPLFERVAAEKGLVEVVAKECEGLFLKGLRVLDGFVAEVLDEFLGFGWRQRGAEKLVDRVEIDRQGVDLPLVGGLDPIGVGHHLAKTIDVIPDFLVVGVKDVGAVLVDLDARCLVAGGVAIAREMGAFVDHMDGISFVRELAGDHCAAETSADAEVV